VDGGVERGRWHQNIEIVAAAKKWATEQLCAQEWAFERHGRNVSLLQSVEDGTELEQRGRRPAPGGEGGGAKPWGRLGVGLQKSGDPMPGGQPADAPFHGVIQ
jgi:hypothetical protein